MKIYVNSVEKKVFVESDFWQKDNIIGLWGLTGSRNYNKDIQAKILHVVW